MRSSHRTHVLGVDVHEVNDAAAVDELQFGPTAVVVLDEPHGHSDDRSNGLSIGSRQAAGQAARQFRQDHCLPRAWSHRRSANVFPHVHRPVVTASTPIGEWPRATYSSPIRNWSGASAFSSFNEQLWFATRRHSRQERSRPCETRIDTRVDREMADKTGHIREMPDRTEG